MGVGRWRMEWMGWHGDVDGMGGHRPGLGTSGQPAFWVPCGICGIHHRISVLEGMANGAACAWTYGFQQLSGGSNLVTFGNGLESVPLLKALVSQAPALWDLGHHATPGSLDSCTCNEMEQHS